MSRPSLGIGLKLGATLAFSLMYACVKLAGDPPLGEAIFFRSFFALIPLFALAIFTIGPARSCAPGGRGCICCGRWRASPRCS